MIDSEAPTFYNASMRVSHFAVRLGADVRDGSLFPPSKGDILFSSADVNDLKCTGPLIYTVRCDVSPCGKKQNGNGIFVSAHLDRSQFIPTGEEKRFFRAYREMTSVEGHPFLPQNLAWSHSEKDYGPNQALLVAKSWFHSDKSKPAFLIEELYIGNILVSARTIAIATCISPT
jgi:hypothetical protein